MKKYSNLLKKDVELSENDLRTSLEVILKGLDGFYYDFQVVDSCKDHSAVLCTMGINSDRVIGVGESTDKNYSTVFATNMAFICSASKILGLPTKELLCSNTKKEKAEAVNEDIPSKTHIETEQKTSDEKETEKPGVITSKGGEGDIVGPLEKLKELGSIEISIGKYKANPTTISEVYEKDNSWYSYIVEKGIGNVLNEMKEYQNLKEAK